MAVETVETKQEGSNIKFMKPILIFFLLVATSFAGEVITFKTKAEAESYLTQVNAKFKVPIKGVNAKTRKVEEKKGKTTSWSRVYQRYDANNKPMSEWYISLPAAKYKPKITPIGSTKKIKDESWEKLSED